MSTWFIDLRIDAAAQADEYRRRRAATPELFGNGADGAMDGTNPITGPVPLIVFSPDQRQGWLLWCIHKWPWPLQYWYCFGKAWDSRGERTDELLMIDVRDIPARYHGRLKLDTKTTWHKNARKIIGCALADGYDLAAHAANAQAVTIAKAEQQRATYIQRAETGLCTHCGKLPATIDGECEPCSEIPF
ncbi:hypothetical protein [Novosphingobium sp. FKTRR1]|uniref:hypothetical protein n=1 Tax=Novosphingobium sp. FKTRR1 TaxID=2879118 RepID=UPI001CF03284|nr:hypothetical protein [Novosphingobium sp. FKTRR1]